MRKKASAMLTAAILVVGTIAYAATHVGDAAPISTKTTFETNGHAEVRQEPITPIIKITDISGDRDYDLVDTLSRHSMVTSVEELRTTVRDYHLGNGEVVLAYNLAHSSGKSVAEIMRMRYDKKMGWGVISKTLGVSLHDQAEKTTVILREAKFESDDVKFRTIIKADLDEDDNLRKEVKKDKDDKHKDNGHNNGKGHSKKK
jgi:hypothetical protein